MVKECEFEENTPLKCEEGYIQAKGEMGET